jgi:hypothetical protein
MMMECLSPAQRVKLPGIFLVTGQLSTAAAILMERYAAPWAPAWLPVDFLTGLLVGVGLTGNLASLVFYSKKIRRMGGTGS